MVSPGLTKAVTLWADFPVHRDPRPIVLTSLTATEQDALRSEMRSRWMADGDTVPESELPAELHAAAVAYCRDVHTGEEQPLARIVRGDGPFATDRGLMTLPAWMMYPDNRRWAFVAMDPQFARQRVWTPPGLVPSDHPAATLAADGRTLTFRFQGAPEGQADYHARIRETDTAVCVEPVAVDRRRPGYAYFDNIVEHTMTGRLAAPLGNRVLVRSNDGSPITVERATA